jgi:hypothetical protein
MTPKTTPPNGAIFDYPYLWSFQSAQKLDNSKTRTCCLAFTHTSASGTTFLVIIPISDRQGSDPDSSIEIPVREKKRAGLDVARPAYLHLDEYNWDRLLDSWYFDPRVRARGRLSDRFTRYVLTELFDKLKLGKAKRVDRTKP